MSYDPKTDAIITRCGDMSKADFARLALACLDQAGLTSYWQNEVHKIVSNVVDLRTPEQT
jgi:hypothetical protein